MTGTKQRSMEQARDVARLLADLQRSRAVQDALQIRLLGDVAERLGLPPQARSLSPGDPHLADRVAHLQRAAGEAARSSPDFDLRNRLDGSQMTLYLGEDNACDFLFTPGATLGADEPFVIKLYLSSLIGDLEKDVRVECPEGWQHRWVQGRFPCTELKRGTGTIEEGVTLTFLLTGIRLPETTAPSTRLLKVGWQQGTDAEQQQELYVTLAERKPEGLFNMTGLQAEFFTPERGDAPPWNVRQNGVEIFHPLRQPDEIFTSTPRDPVPLELSNRVWFSLTNTDPHGPIKNEHTWFQVSFRTGDGRQALTRNNAHVDLKPWAGNNWTVSRDTSSGSPVWTLNPPAGGPNVLEAPGCPGSSVAFVFTGLAHEEAGMTTVDVSFFSFPGYTDGRLSLRIWKRFPEPTLFKAENPLEMLVESKDGLARLHWETFGGLASLVTYPGPPQGTPVTPASAAGGLAVDARSATRRLYTLRLLGAHGRSCEHVLARTHYVGPNGFGTFLGIRMTYQQIHDSRQHRYAFFHLVLRHDVLEAWGEIVDGKGVVAQAFLFRTAVAIERKAGGPGPYQTWYEATGKGFRGQYFIGPDDRIYALPDPANHLYAGFSLHGESVTYSPHGASRHAASVSLPGTSHLGDPPFVPSNAGLA